MAGYYSGAGRLYRSRRGEILGVCRGIAEWRDIPVSMVRWGFILLAIFTAFMPVAFLYGILGLILPLEPASGSRRNHSNPHEDIKADFENLRDRVNKMEEERFDKERDWEDRFRSGR